MNKSKLGSIFLKEIDQYERSVVGGMTARIFIMVLGDGDGSKSSVSFLKFEPKVSNFP